MFPMFLDMMLNWDLKLGEGVWVYFMTFMINVFYGLGAAKTAKWIK
jgi:hypothetical protein